MSNLSCLKTGINFKFNGKIFTGDLFYDSNLAALVIRGIPHVKGIASEANAEIYHIEVHNLEQLQERGAWLDIQVLSASYTDIFLAFLQQWAPADVLEQILQEWSPMT